MATTGEPRWTEAAMRQADFCRRKHLPIECWSTLIPRVNEAARAEERRRVTIPFVMEVCRQMQNEVAYVEARREVCEHDWRQVELDGQECRLCGASRIAFSSGYESYLG